MLWTFGRESLFSDNTPFVLFQFMKRRSLIQLHKLNSDFFVTVKHLTFFTWGQFLLCIYFLLKVIKQNYFSTFNVITIPVVLHIHLASNVLTRWLRWSYLLIYASDTWNQLISTKSERILQNISDVVCDDYFKLNVLIFVLKLFFYHRLHQRHDSLYENINIVHTCIYIIFIYSICI